MDRIEAVQVSEAQLVNELKSLRERHEKTETEILSIARDLNRLRQQAGNGHFKAAYKKAGWAKSTVYWYLDRLKPETEELSEAPSPTLDPNGKKPLSKKLREGLSELFSGLRESRIALDRWDIDLRDFDIPQGEREKWLADAMAFEKKLHKLCRELQP